EASLLKLIDRATPSVARIEAALLDARAARQEYEETFSPAFFAAAQTADTRERALIPFAPVFAPTRGAAIGFEKNLPLGVDVTLGISADQRTASTLTPPLTNGTTLTGSVELGIDLWRDLLGFTSRAKRRQLAAEEERSAIE